MIKKIAFIFILANLILSNVKAQTVNVNGLELWLKNDFGVITSGGFVTEWKDASGNNNDCIQTNPSFQPGINISIPSINNNNGSLVFDGVDDYLPFTTRLTNIRTVFFVVKHNGINVPFGPILGDNTGYDFLGDDVANNIFNSLYTSANILNGNIRINKTAVGTVSNAARPSNYSIISLTTTGNVAASQITRDRTFSSRVWGGEYSEVMIYNRLFTAIQIDSIENYLADKYSPTLELGGDIFIQQLNGCIPSNSITIQANPDFQAYLWSTGITSNQINVTQYGEYSVICTDIFGIQHFDTIHVVPSAKTFNYPPQILCGNTSITWDTQLNHTDHTFQWQNFTTDSLLIINSPGQYYVTVTDLFGCVYNSSTVTITQDNFPSQVSLGPDLFNLCIGNSIFLTNGASSVVSYTWSDGSTNDSLLITTTGQYSVVVTNTNNCVAKDTINITVGGSAPIANFSNSVGCLSSSVSFIDLSIPPIGDIIDSTIWDFGDLSSGAANTSTLTNPSHTYTSTGTYTVKLKAITDAGCEQTIIKTITVYPKPAVNFSHGSTCLNDSTSFTSLSTSTSGYSITSLSWDFGDPISGTANNSTLQQVKHLYNTQANYYIKLIASNNVGCKDSTTKSIFVSPCAQTVNLNGLELWLKNDYGVVTSGGFVTEWKDASGNNNDCTQSNPSFRPGINLNIPSINSNNNSLVFDGADDYLRFDTVIPNIRTVFFMIKHNGINVPFAPILGDSLGTDFLGDDLANNIFGQYTDVKIQNGNLRINKIAITTVTIAARPLNYSIISLTTTGNVKASQITRDRTFSSRVWGGEYCEVMIYNRLFTAIQIDSIEDYLADKYSPTLELGSDIFIQQLNSCIPSNSITIQANPDFQSYLWSTGITSNQINVNQYGEYSVICTDVFGIQHFDTIHVIPSVKNFNYPPSNILCGNTSITWDTQLNHTENTFQWQDATFDSLLVINNPGQYSITVTDTFGCVYNSNIITITQDNFPTTASLGPDISLCSGNSITLTSGVSPSLTYTWSTSSTNSSIIINTAGQYFVTVTNTNNCIAKDTINVTVSGQAPTANFSSNIGCLNSLVIFSNLSVPPVGNTIDSTIWNFGDPLSTANTSTISNPVHTYTNTGTYTVSLKVKTDADCEQSITKTINIYPVPTATFITGVSCQNDSTSFLNQSTSPSGFPITSSYWNFGDFPNPTYTTNIASPKHIFNNYSNYTVRLTVSNSAGCKDSIYKTVVVQAEVKANFTNGPACLNQPTNFQSTSIIPPSGTPVYLWSFGASTANLANPIKTYTNSGVYNVSLTVDGNNGCISSITKLINVYLSPVASFSIPAFCAKDTSTILNLSNSQSGIIASNNWRLNNVSFSGVQSPTLSIANAGTYSIRLTTTNSFGCKDSTTNSLTIFPLPLVDFTTNPAAFYYLNEPVSFIPSITNASSYLWNMNSGSTYTIQSPTQAFSPEGSYNVTLNLKDQQGCKGSKTKNITISKRQLDLAILNVTTLKDNDGFMTVIADLANYGSVPINSFEMHYQISDAGNIKETWSGTLAPNSFYEYTFNARSSSVKNSTNNITCVEIEKVNTITDDNSTNNSLCNTLNFDDIYVSNPLPNPTDGDIVLPITLNKDLDYTIIIYNSVGQIQYDETTKKGLQGLNFVPIYTSSYARGVYIIKVMVNDKTFIKKFVKISSE